MREDTVGRACRQGEGLIGDGVPNDHFHRDKNGGADMIKILIVDDEKPICDLIEMNLSAAGYSCVAVQDGLAAIDAVEKNTFDLVLLDIMLPARQPVKAD